METKMRRRIAYKIEIGSNGWKCAGGSGRIELITQSGDGSARNDWLAIVAS
jgi:hypothetical protein